MVELGASGKPKLDGDELAALKKKLREQSNIRKQQPLFRLRNTGELANLNVESDTRAPLYISDIQHLLMYSQLGVMSPYLPNKWCQLDKYNNLSKINVLIVSGCSVDDYFSHKQHLSFLVEKFTCKLEIVSPDAYKSDITTELLMVPITNTYQKKLLHKYKTLAEAEAKSTDVFDLRKDLAQNEVNGAKKSFDDKVESFYRGKLPVGEKFPRTQLLLSGWQMVAENFPLPIKGLEEKWPKYVATKEKYEPVTNFSPMFGIDCEMCMTTAGQSELTRVSLVNEKLEVIYDSLVKPYNRITNYLTQYSGVTKKMMTDVKKRLQHVQKEIQDLLPPDAILVGQSVNNDLHALKLMHPYIIDTSFIYNTTGQRNRKTKLKTLVEYFLNEKIQESSKGHCSNEDSAASLKLTQLKLKNNIAFGDVLLSGGTDHLKALPDLGNINYSCSLFKYIGRPEKPIYLYANDVITSKYNFYSSKNKNTAGNNLFTFTIDKKKTLISTFSTSENKFNIAHVTLDCEKVKNEPKSACKKINGWVKSVYESSPEQSLVIVLFSGHASSNGCAFIDVKK